MNGIIKASDGIKKVAGVSPDSSGNVPLNAGNVGAIPTVGGAAEGAIPTFNGRGNLASSGITMSSFHRCKFSLEGTTLTITTVS